MTKEQNQYVGWALFSVLLIGYFHFFSPVSTKKETEKEQEVATQTVTTSAASQLKKALSPLFSSKKKYVTLENDLMTMMISPQGGHVQKVILKNYKNYDGSPLVIVNEESGIGMSLPTKEGQFYTQSCQFEATSDHVVVTDTGQGSLSLIYRDPNDPERYIKHTFTLQKGSYKVGCEVEVKGFDIDTTSDSQPTLIWYQQMRRLEKDAIMSRREVVSYYYLADKDKVSYFSPRKKEKVETVQDPIGWMTISQKFFTTSIITGIPFQEAELISNSITDKKDPDVLKEVGVKLTLAPETFKNGLANFTFYFGPSEQTLLKGIAPKFEENRFMGVTPVRQINKYLIIPMSDYLEGYVDHCLLVLLLLLLLLALLQLPLLYHNYILEVKKKALAPMIADLKAKYKDDPAKAEMKETQLKNKAGLFSVWSILSSMLPVVIWTTMLYFIRYNIHFRQVSFLWMEDLSTYDSLIHLPFRIPFLGAHISLAALLASFVMMMAVLLRKNKSASSSSEEKAIQYIFPLILLVFFNSYSVTLHLYRMMSQLINLIPKLFFKRIVDEGPIHEAVLARLAEKETGSKLPRTHMRFQKRKKKKEN